MQLSSFGQIPIIGFTLTWAFSYTFLYHFNMFTLLIVYTSFMTVHC
jgi:hypothetical protein